MRCILCNGIDQMSGGLKDKRTLNSTPHVRCGRITVCFPTVFTRLFYSVSQNDSGERRGNMFLIKSAKVRSYEKGLYFQDREFKGLLEEGRHWFLDPFCKVKVAVVSQRNAWFVHEDLDMIVKSGALKGHANVLDLKDYQRALVWVNGRFEQVLGPGLYALWTNVCDVKVEVIDVEDVRFNHTDLNVIAKSDAVEKELNISIIEQGFAGVYFKDGVYVETFGPGQYMFWKNMGKVKVYHVDMRETVLDVSGQEIMTSDKVTLRMNAVITYRVADAFKSVSVVDDSRQAVYREAQLALRCGLLSELLIWTPF